LSFELLENLRFSDDSESHEASAPRAFEVFDFVRKATIPEPAKRYVANLN